jgi:hypothetical protein
LALTVCQPTCLVCRLKKRADAWPETIDWMDCCKRGNDGIGWIRRSREVGSILLFHLSLLIPNPSSSACAQSDSKNVATFQSDGLLGGFRKFTGKRNSTMGESAARDGPEGKQVSNGGGTRQCRSRHCCETLFERCWHLNVLNVLNSDQNETDYVIFL